MKSYTVYEAPGPAPSEVERAERLVFIREGFSWFALLLPLVWMIFNRTWISLLIFVGVVFAMQLVAYLLGSGEEALAFASVLLNVAIGFEANNLRRWEYEQQGYQLIATVSGSSLEECELKFFTEWLEKEHVATDLTQIAAKSVANDSSPVPGRVF